MRPAPHSGRVRPFVRNQDHRTQVTRREPAQRSAAGAVTVVTPEDWGGVGGYPLGQWIARQRRARAAGTLEAGRVAELEKLGTVWSEQDTDPSVICGQYRHRAAVCDRNAETQSAPPREPTSSATGCGLRPRCRKAVFRDRSGAVPP
ncbi:Helicase associated domain protein [Streptomyces sp. CLV115]|uniref:Helicase associated domain protein n=1 Tax=Streptomyces sp. CLV115 TaxID=3138502 RepID=UPI00313DCA64